MPQKLTTTACFIQTISETCELFLCSRRKRGGIVIKIACIAFFL